MSNDRQLAEAEVSRLREAILRHADMDALWQTSMDTAHSRRFIIDECREAL